MFKEILTFPSRHLIYVIPSTIVSGLAVGYFVDASSLKGFILPVVVFMIYPTMIGFELRELLDLSERKLVVLSLFINFILVPIVAYVLGLIFLLRNPELFAGLAIASLLPTSNMTIAYTMFAGGNVKASVKLVALSLILGSVLAPWYLYFMIGRYVPVDIWLIFRTIGIVVFLPLTMGILTFKYLKKRYTEEEFNKGIKPLLPGISVWGVIFVIFTSASMNSKLIFSSADNLVIAIFVQTLFYLINYVLAVAGSKQSKLNRADSYTLVYSTGLRNLAISIGLATTFGVQAALMVSLAFLFQAQAAAWFTRLDRKYQFLPS